MLYILILIGLIFIIWGIISDQEFLIGLGAAVSFIFVLITLGVIISYNNLSTTSDSKLAVLEEQNKTILVQIEPIVQKALEHESSTYKDLKLDVAKIIAFTQLYPDLKANTFLNRQIDIILCNQHEIKNLKLGKASLNAYSLWLWTPKIN